MPKNAITEEVLQESCCCFHSMGGHPTLLKPAIPFILFQQVLKTSDTVKCTYLHLELNGLPEFGCSQLTNVLGDNKMKNIPLC
jgi:hypothetical protein